MKKNYKLRRKKNSGRILTIALTLAASISIGAALVSINQDKYNMTTTPAPTQVVNDYIDTMKYNEFFTYDKPTEKIPITISNYDYMQLMDFIKSNPDHKFSYSQYYGLEYATQLYKENIITKSSDSNLLDAQGKLDPSKLINIVLENNAKTFEGGKNTINIFYKELSRTEITKLCNLIAEVANNRLSATELKKLSNTLTQLKIFERTGCASNAYVTNDITLVYNPTMSQNYSNIQGLQGKDPETTLKGVLTHEIMHLIQYASNDINDSNGIEAGICRMYNLPGKDKNIPVDSLWYSWVLDAGAELGMADYLNIKPGTYAKKISYANSYNLSRFNELNSTSDTLENTIFSHSLEEAYEQLGIETDEEKQNFLNYMYSVEITQTEPNDFFEYYESQTGKTLTEEEKLAIRMDIREDAVIYLTNNFYSNLVNAINEGTITDLNTVFYLVRIWELDSFNHLEYTKTKGLEHAKDFIEWQQSLQEGLFSAIATSSNLDKDTIVARYSEYNLNIENENGEITQNCNLDSFNSFTQYYLSKAPSNYSTANFSHNSDVHKYIQENSKKKQPQLTT